MKYDLTYDGESYIDNDDDEYRDVEDVDDNDDDEDDEDLDNDDVGDLRAECNSSEWHSFRGKFRVHFFL
ncbi:hypothetical protein ACF0H5_023427 [Mactra antiquata]